HVILAPPLRPTSVGPDGQPASSGTKARRFQRALFRTLLSPGSGEQGGFAERLLTRSPAGAAMWGARYKTYLGMDIYVSVQISTGATANVFREFKIMNSLVDFRRPANPFRCGSNHCVSDPPPASIVEYVSDFGAPTLHSG